MTVEERLLDQLAILLDADGDRVRSFGLAIEHAKYIVTGDPLKDLYDLPSIKAIFDPILLEADKTECLLSEYEFIRNYAKRGSNE